MYKAAEGNPVVTSTVKVSIRQENIENNYDLFKYG